MQVLFLEKMRTPKSSVYAGFRKTPSTKRQNRNSCLRKRELGRGFGGVKKK